MRLCRIVSMIVVGLVATYAHGQQFGVPVATDAASVTGGTMEVSGGLVLGDDINLYGGRFTYHLAHDFSLFGDLGLVDVDKLDMGFGAQIGGLFLLPGIVGVPLDFGVRGTLGYGMVSDDFDLDFLSFSAMGIASYTIDEMFSVYGVLGFAYIREEISFGGSSSTDSDTEPAIGVGALVNFVPELSAYIELIHIDDPWIGLGAAFRF